MSIEIVIDKKSYFSGQVAVNTGVARAEGETRNGRFCRDNKRASNKNKTVILNEYAWLSQRYLND